MTYLLTLQLDANLQHFFEQQRQCYFPKHLNRVPAHVMLFHQLPLLHKQRISNDCAAIAAITSVLAVYVIGIRCLGRGNAYVLKMANHRVYLDLKRKWQQWLIPQDLQPWVPHVTVQNKVSPQEAKKLYSDLNTDFQPLEGTATGITLWRYHEGDWEWVDDYPFLA